MDVNFYIKLALSTILEHINDNGREHEIDFVNYPKKIFVNLSHVFCLLM